MKTVHVSNGTRVHQGVDTAQLWGRLRGLCAATAEALARSLEALPDARTHAHARARKHTSSDTRARARDRVLSHSHAHAHRHARTHTHAPNEEPE